MSKWGDQPGSSDTDGWIIDESLSVGIDKSKASAFFSQTCPPLYNEYSDLKKLNEDLRKENKDLHKKEKEDLHKKYEDLHKKYEDLPKKYEDLHKKEKEDLHKKYEDLHKKHEDLHKKEKEDLHKKYEDLHKRYEDLQSAEAFDLKSKAVLRQLLRNFILRQESLRRSGKIGHHEEVNVVLMQKAREKSLKDFPFDFFPKTFTGTVAALVNEKANKSTKYKLDLLRDVAKAFRSNSLRWWDADMGEQFFILCKSVPQWNNEDFHPKLINLERRECQKKADKGMYSVDDVNLGRLVKELLHPDTVHSFVD